MAVRTAKKPSVNGTVAEHPEPGIVVPPLQVGLIAVPIRGKTPLIVHAWSQKAKNMMLAKQMKVATPKKEAKDPEADYFASRYIADEEWDGVPAGGFKAALVGAARQVEGLAMTTAKRMLFVLADGRSTVQNVDLVRIEGSHRMLESMVRLETGVADIRYRAIYDEWSAVLQIEYSKNIISAEQVVHLVEIAGHSEGICEHRPSSPKNCTGSYGRWSVVRD